MIESIFLYFLAYSFVGWAWEGLISLVRDHKIVNRGFLNGPYCPIYGIGALMFIGLTYLTQNPLIMFLVGGVAACILEYLTSYFMEKLFKARWWDYSKRFLNINGRICLLGFVIFGAGAVGVLYIQPYLANIVASISEKPLLSTALAVLFTWDVISTNQSAAHFTKILRAYQSILMKGRFAQFFERKGRRFIQTINDRRHRIFTWQQRRLMRAFPNFQTSYDRAYSELQKFYQNTKFKPIKPQKAHARKKSKKILK